MKDEMTDEVKDEMTDETNKEMESITSSMDEFCVVLIVSFIYVLSIRLSLHHLSNNYFCFLIH